MFDLIKNLIPRRFKIDPLGSYNRLRKILGVARYRYNSIKKVIDNNPEIPRLFPEEKMREHYVREPMLQTVEFPVLYVTQIRYYRMYKYFQLHYPDLFDVKTQIIDVGDTSGALFQAMGKDGLSVNIHSEIVESIRRNGIRAKIEDAENISFNDKSFDYAFCFQTLEHLKNPLKALDELGRITRKRVFLSVPYVERTSIFNKDFIVNVKKISSRIAGKADQEVRDTDCHIFEFSTKDFKNILSYTRLEYVDNFPISYFVPLGETRKNKGAFINFFILKPRGSHIYEDKR